VLVAPSSVHWLDLNVLHASNQTIGLLVCLLIKQVLLFLQSMNAPIFLIFTLEKTNKKVKAP